MLRLILSLGLILLLGGCLGTQATQSDPSAIQSGPESSGNPASSDVHRVEPGSTQAGNPPALDLAPRNPVAEVEVIRGQETEESSTQLFYDWKVRWDPPEAPFESFIAYEVYRRIGSKGTLEKIATYDDPAERSFQEKGAYGATHYFQIVAVDKGRSGSTPEFTAHRIDAHCEFKGGASENGWAMVSPPLGCFHWRKVSIQDPQNVSFKGQHKDGRDVVLHRRLGVDGKPSFEFQYPTKETEDADALIGLEPKKELAAYPELKPLSQVITDVQAAGDQVFVTTSEGFILERTRDGCWEDLWADEIALGTALKTACLDFRGVFRPTRSKPIERFGRNFFAGLVDLFAVSEKELYLLEETPSGNWRLHQIDGVTGSIVSLPNPFNKGRPSRLWGDSSRIFIATSEGVYRLPLGDRFLQNFHTAITEIPANEAPAAPPLVLAQKIPGTDYEITALAKINETNQWAIADRKYLFRYCH